MKLSRLIAFSALALFTCAAPTMAENATVGDFTLGSRGWLSASSTAAVIYPIPDPDVRGVTCFVTTLESRGWTMDDDPSNTSIACRQTGQLFEEDTRKVVQGKEGEDIFTKDKAGWGKGGWADLFKSMQVRRIYDPITATYLYITYVTTGDNSSNKISMSAVTAYGQF